VTGAAGLIGNAVRTKLEASGWTVVPLDLVDASRDGKPIMVCDLGDIHRMHALARSHKIEGIIHCGAHSGPMVARDNPYSMVQVNVVGSLRRMRLNLAWMASVCDCPGFMDLAVRRTASSGP
jgi:UDP-glucuronate 4-epimerase